MITKLIDKISSPIISAIGNAIDELITSEEEKLILKNKLEEIKQSYHIQLQSILLHHEQEITKRWVSDKDGWLTRNTRPVILLTLTSFFIILTFFAGFGWLTISESWIGVYQTLLLTSYGAYFGSRGLEKITKYKHE